MIKYRQEIVITVVLFLIVYTSYYWAGLIHFFALILYFINRLVFLILLIVLIFHIVKAFKENFAKFDRNMFVLIMSVFLVLIAVKLSVKSDKMSYNLFHGKDILLAKYRSVEGCEKTIRLKPNNRFKFTFQCFMTFDTRGKYELRNDTIYFSDLMLRNGGNAYYKYAVFVKSSEDDDNDEYLYFYRSFNESYPDKLKVIKNEIK